MQKKDFITYLKQLLPEDWGRMATSKWTVKDVVAHLAGWEKDDIEVIRKAWETKQKPWFDTSKEYADYNAHWVEQYRKINPEQLIQDLEAAQEAVQQEIDRIGEGNLKQHYELFAWLFDESETSHYGHHWAQIKKAIENSQFEKVIPTAWMVAYRRTFSDIPYSKEIFDKLEHIRQSLGQEISSDLKKPEMAPQFEARHKLIDKLINEAGNTQILELASGFSSRGFSMARDKNIQYIELDLPPVIKEKEQILKEIAEEGQINFPSNLYFEGGNVLDIDTIRKAVQHFNKTKPLTIVNEGLLRYLNFEEKAIVANNIHSILKEYGGVWITSDISLRKIFSNENALMKNHVEKISELTGKDIVANRFETEAEAKTFFENLGFTIESRSFFEVYDDLASPSALGLSAEQTQTTLEAAVVFVMTPR